MKGILPEEGYKRNALFGRDKLWNTKDVPYVLDRTCK